MWYITYENKDSIPLIINNIFKNKSDAFTYIKNTMKNGTIKNIQINNAETTLMSNLIKNGATMQIQKDNLLEDYGVITDISNYLITIRIKDGSEVEFTKSRVNKEYLDGVFKIKKEV